LGVEDMKEYGSCLKATRTRSKGRFNRAVADSSDQKRAVKMAQMNCGGWTAFRPTHFLNGRHRQKVPGSYVLQEGKRGVEKEQRVERAESGCQASEEATNVGVRSNKLPDGVALGVCHPVGQGAATKKPMRGKPETMGRRT